MNKRVRASKEDQDLQKQVLHWKHQAEDLKQQVKALQLELHREREQRALLMKGELRARQAENDILQRKLLAMEQDCAQQKRLRTHASKKAKSLEDEMVELKCANAAYSQQVCDLQARLSSSALSKAAMQREAHLKVQHARDKAQHCEELLVRERERVQDAERKVCTSIDSCRTHTRHCSARTHISAACTHR